MSDTPPVADEIDRLAHDILTHGSDALRPMFAAAGARTPVLTWSPEQHDLENPILRRVAALGHAMADAGGRIQAADFDLNEFAQLADWMLVIEPGEIPGALRHAHYGTRIVETYGRDMKGESTEAFGGHIGLFYSAIYRAMAIRGEWLLSEHEPPRSVFVRRWRRLILPMYSGERVTHFAAANVPDNELRTGLELMVDPVFVCDRDQTVRYANKAARRLFHAHAEGGRGKTLGEVTGITLANLPNPGEMVARSQSQDSIELIDRDSIVERLVMTVSATEHRGESFYVAVMRMIGT